MDAVTSGALVKLIADEGQDVGAELRHTLHERDVGEDRVDVARDVGDRERLLVDGIAAHGAGPIVVGGAAGAIAQGVDETIGDVPGIVPGRDAKRRGAGGGMNFRCSHGFPAGRVLELETHGSGVLQAERRHLGGEFKHAIAEGVLRPQDGPEHLIVVAGEFGATRSPVGEPEPAKTEIGAAGRGVFLGLGFGPEGTGGAEKIIYEREVADEEIAAEPRLSDLGEGTGVGGIERGERGLVSTVHRGDGQTEIKGITGEIDRRGGGPSGTTEEQGAGSGETGVETGVRGGPQVVAVVVQFGVVFERAQNTDTESGRALTGEGWSVGAADAYAEFKGAGAAGELAGEEVDVAIGGGVDALDPLVGDLPVLKGIRPVFRAEPDAIARAVPRAAERLSWLAGVQVGREARGEERRGGEGRRALQEIAAVELRSWGHTEKDGGFSGARECDL